MFWANPMPRSNDAALEKGERGFDRVRVNFSHDVHVAAVVDGFVRHSCDSGSRLVRCEVIGNNHVHIGFDVLSNVLRKRSGLHIVSVKQSEIAVALANPNHDFFIVVLGDVAFSPILATNVRFVHLNRSGQFGLCGFFHRCANAMAEIPCCLVGDSERALNLASGDTLLGLTEKQCRHEPFLKWEMRVIKDRASGYGKLVVAALAVKQLLVGLKFYRRVIAAWADRAIVPTEAAKQFSALFSGSVAAYERC